MPIEKQYIYGLFNDSINELVYVGCTKNPESRKTIHSNSTCKDFKKHLRLEVLDETIFCGAEVESFWINSMLSLGCNLRNKDKKKSAYDSFLRMNRDEEADLIRYKNNILYREEMKNKQMFLSLRQSIKRKFNCKYEHVIFGDGQGI